MVHELTPLGSTPALKEEESKNPFEELIKEIAMDIGKEVVAHIETMYPEMFKAVAGTAKLSVRNTVYNEIMAAIKVNEEGQIIKRLERRKKWRRARKAMCEIFRGNKG